ncbi:MAG: hypothetical protein LBT47_02255 [Deltaproteobacteria bacterium]|nr:hypothetical protein [Deltaproteobacteria bacterium]
MFQTPERASAAPLTASILSTGSELVSGQMVDTNSAWLSSFLAARGLRVVRHVSVGDDLPHLTALFKESWELSEVTVVTGGLGPTEDDLTRAAVARAFSLPLSFKPNLATDLQDLIYCRGYKFSPNQYRQAWLPDGTELVPNHWGSAPAFCLDRPGRLMLFLPGVPVEMKNITENFLGPRLAEKFPSRLGLLRTTIHRAAGLGEGRVDHLLGDLIRDSINPSVGLLAGPYETRILITVKASGAVEADQLEAPLTAQIINRLGDYYVGRDDTTMVSSIAQVVTQKDLRLAIIDATSDGEAARPFFKLLSAKNLVGTLTCDHSMVKAGIKFVFENLNASLVMVLTKVYSHRCHVALPDQRHFNPHIKGQIHLLAADNDGWQEVDLAKLSYDDYPDMIKARFASLAAFRLWRYLCAPQGFSDDQPDGNS